MDIEIKVRVAVYDDKFDLDSENDCESLESEIFDKLYEIGVIDAISHVDLDRDAA